MQNGCFRYCRRRRTIRSMILRLICNVLGTRSKYIFRGGNNMKDVIKSGIHDLDLLRASAENYIRYIYEYIGIYQKYIVECDYKDINFEKYYEEHRNITEYHFVNKGVQFLGEMLECRYLTGTFAGLARLTRAFR